MLSKQTTARTDQERLPQQRANGFTDLKYDLHFGNHISTPTATTTVAYGTSLFSVCPEVACHHCSLICVCVHAPRYVGTCVSHVCMHVMNVRMSVCLYVCMQVGR